MLVDISPQTCIDQLLMSFHETLHCAVSIAGICFSLPIPQALGCNQLPTRIVSETALYIRGGLSH